MNNDNKLTFPKSERLCSVKDIEKLFDRRSKDSLSEFAFPLKVVYREVVDNEPITKVIFSVPKKSFKKAVDRNTIKRRLKEAYRLNKSNFEISAKHIIFIYVSKNIESYQLLEKSIVSILKKLSTIKKS